MHMVDQPFDTAADLAPELCQDLESRHNSYIRRPRAKHSLAPEELVPRTYTTPKHTPWPVLGLWPKHSLLTIPCHPNRRGRRHSGR